MSGEPLTALDEEARLRIRAEEIYREEVRKGLAGDQGRLAMCMAFMGRPIMLWILTVSVGVLLTSTVEGCFSRRVEEKARTQQKERARIELGARYHSHLQWVMIATQRQLKKLEDIHRELSNLDGASAEDSACLLAELPSVARGAGEMGVYSVAELAQPGRLEAMAARARVLRDDAQRRSRPYAASCFEALEASFECLRGLVSVWEEPPRGGAFAEFRESTTAEILMLWASIGDASDGLVTRAFKSVNNWTSLRDAGASVAAELHWVLSVTAADTSSDAGCGVDCLREFGRRLETTTYLLRGYGEQLRAVGGMVEAAAGGASSR